MLVPHVLGEQFEDLRVLIAMQGFCVMPTCD